VVELADTTDLKSVGFGLAGSIPAVRTGLKLNDYFQSRGQRLYCEILWWVRRWVRTTEKGATQAPSSW
jgi:hypothetical protein